MIEFYWTVSWFLFDKLALAHPGREDKGMGTNWQRYVETLIAEQEPLSFLNLTRRSEYTRYHTHGEEGLGILGIVAL